jgi:hypothetical protein
MGAAIAYYTVFSLAPMLVMVIAIAGLAFGQQAAEGALFGEDLIGPESAAAVQAMLRSASGTRSGIFATAVGIGALIIAATAVLGELQSALNVIWRAQASRGLGVWHLLMSLVISTALTAFSDYLDWLLPGLVSVRLRSPCEDETGLNWSKFPAQEADICAVSTHRSLAMVRQPFNRGIIEEVQSISASVRSSGCPPHQRSRARRNGLSGSSAASENSVLQDRNSRLSGEPKIA